MCPWVLYRDRPEWSDVQPVPQDESERSVLKISYTEKFIDVHDYLRACMRANELSERALALTADAIDLNAANYTTWSFRRAILADLRADMANELQFVHDMIVKNQKNYQVWYHRRWVAERMGDSGAKELQLTREVLDEDAKNYHAWEHRQWAIRHFNLWDNELAFTELLINNDVRNNSAWHQRHFVLTSTTGLTPEVVARETEFARDWIRQCPNNESSWSYLRGLRQVDGLAADASLEQFCRDLLAKDSRGSPHPLAFLVDCLAERLDAGGAAQESREELATEALQLLQQLAGSVDRVRRKYWQFVARDLLLRHGGTAPEGLLDSSDEEET